VKLNSIREQFSKERSSFWFHANLLLILARYEKGVKVLGEERRFSQMAFRDWGTLKSRKNRPEEFFEERERARHNLQEVNED